MSRVLAIDDPARRHLISILRESGYEVVGEGASGAAGVAFFGREYCTGRYVDGGRVARSRRNSGRPENHASEFSCDRAAH